MKIVVLSPYADPIKGGITSYTRELIDSYQRLGNETEGFAVEGRTGARFSVLGPSRVAFAVRAFLWLATIKPELVHVHSHWHVLLPGLLYRKVRRRSCLLFTFHTMLSDSDSRIGYLVLRAMLLASDGVTFVSQGLRDAIAVPRSVRQAVVHPAPERRTSQLVAETGAVDHPTVVFVGPLIWPKKAAGVGHLIEAFAMVVQSHPNWRLTIVGDGPFKVPLEEKARRLGLADRIVFRGQVEDAVDTIARAQIYAHVSLQEGLPLSLLNAMALGKPIIATAVGGMKEVIVDGVTGRLIPPSVEAIAAALSDLFRDDPLRRRLGEAAREWVSKEMSWENVARRHLQLCGEA